MLPFLLTNYIKLNYKKMETSVQKAQKVLPTPTSVKDIVGKDKIQFQLSREPGKTFPGYPPTEIIPMQCEILFIPEKLDAKGNGTGVGDMEAAHNRHIAYVPGMRSIFVDEWSDAEKERLRKREGMEGIKFMIGFKTVSTQERNLLLYNTCNVSKMRI